MNSKRIVITGIGAISSNAGTKDEFWNALTEGRYNFSDVKSLDTGELKVQKSCEIQNFDIKKYSTHPDLDKMGKASRIACAAVKMAFEDAGINVEDYAKDRIAVTIGSTFGESKVFEKMNDTWHNNGLNTVEQNDFLQIAPHAIPFNIASFFGLKGPGNIFMTACCAGNDALIHACLLLKENRSDIVVAGGVELLSRVGFYGFSRMKNLSPEMCKPFDLNRKGVTGGEGAGILILERLDHALNRKAYIYGEIAGYSTTCDAYHPSAPDSDTAGGLFTAFKKAVENSGLRPEEIDYICAHGTGTKHNDKTETAAIKYVLGKTAYKIPVSSVKSMIGHTGGAAGALETIACLLALEKGIIPPTMNYETPDPECDLNYVNGQSIKKAAKTAINNTFAFGGNNSIIVLKKYSDSNRR